MIATKSFGVYSGREVKLFVLKNDLLEVGISDFGAIIQYIKVKTASGMKDVCVGFNSVEEYVLHNMHTGGTIGRVANRIGGASFALNGTRYALDDNDGGNCLHSGFNCYDIRFFDSEVNDDVLKLSLISPNLDQGFPGCLQFSVEYKLLENGLNIRYIGVSDEDTLFCPTNHTYFNVDGEDNGPIYDNLLCIYSDKITPIDGKLITNGEYLTVEGTPFDFRDMKKIGKDLFLNHEQLICGGGYDHNFVLNGEHVATVKGEKSGITLDIYSDYPGVQFYSGNMIGNVKGKSQYSKHHGFCLEPQYFPNAINHCNFEQPILKKGETKEHYIKYLFSVN